MNLDLDLSILSTEQRLAFEKFCLGENLFVTGPGGTGKTKLIEFFVQYCKKVGKICQVSAMTGCATTLLPPLCNARTIHSWSGIKLCKGEKNKIIQGALRKKMHCDAWRKTQVLIVDEVSMMSKKVFEILEEIGRTARLLNQPFGGMQVIFTGDFLQLPPVPTQNEKDSAKFCFETELWEKIFPLPNNIVLNTIFRQSDPIYQNILLEVRKGKLSEPNIQILQQYVQKNQEIQSISRPIESISVITKLFPVRFKTDSLNQYQYAKLEEQEYTYLLEQKTDCKVHHENGKLISVENMLKCDALTKFEREFELRNLLTTTNYPETLCLKKGCVVMCMTNMDLENNICNGTQGIVMGFTNTDSSSNTSKPIVRFTNGVVRIMEPQIRQSDEYPCFTVAQIPLCLAWALTIHKIQGATLEKAEMDIGAHIFECGQTYVALSRIKSLEGLSLSAFQPNNIRANPRALAFYKEVDHMDCEKELEKLRLEKGLSSPTILQNPFAEFELKEEPIETQETKETPASPETQESEEETVKTPKTSHLKSNK